MKKLLALAHTPIALAHTFTFAHTLAIITLIILATPTNTHAINKNNFHFDSFEADYYITKDTDNVSHMHVVEQLTAVFPDYNQNLGIVRYIPYTNNAGRNITVPSKNALNIKITRGGLKEPIYSIEREDGYYAVATGDDTTYLHGTQTFTLEYDFEKVITDFSDFQELYWDTNGTGWAQYFESLTARVHFADPTVLSGKSPSCYVGSYGSSSEDRCIATKIDDGFSFVSTGRLSAGENLTFSIDILPNSFTVPITYNYTFLALTIIFALLSALAIYYIRQLNLATADKKQFYKSLFVAPQYQPMQNLSVAEMAEIATISTRDARVASLIDLAVHHKITLIRNKRRWSIQINDLSNIAPEQLIVLQILKNGEDPAPGETISITQHQYSSQLSLLAKSFADKTKSALTRKGLLEKKPTKQDLSPARRYYRNTAFLGIINIFLLIPVVFFVALGLESGGTNFGSPYTPIAAAILILFSIIAPSIAAATSYKYVARTTEGLRTARYAEGLRLYIKMAESDRIQFLQSVDGIDTSPTGIVRLYEKLLPYAILFGLETSWLKEMSRYYELADNSSPTWYDSPAGRPFRPAEIGAFIHTSSTSITHSTASTSSGSSGGGGGGFSGGGGGGGGGGGR